MKARAQFFQKKGKRAQKNTNIWELFYHFSKGHSHTCNYCMYERSKLCLAFNHFSCLLASLLIYFCSLFVCKTHFFQVKQPVPILAFFQNFNNINVTRQYSHFKTIMLNIQIFGPYWLYNTTNRFVSILSLTAVSLHY